MTEQQPINVGAWAAGAIALTALSGCVNWFVSSRNAIHSARAELDGAVLKVENSDKFRELTRRLKEEHQQTVSQTCLEPQLLALCAVNESLTAMQQWRAATRGCGAWEQPDDDNGLLIQV